MQPVGKEEKGRMGSVGLALKGGLMGRPWAWEAQNARSASELVKNKLKNPSFYVPPGLGKITKEKDGT